MTNAIPDNFYERIKPRLHRRIGREVRLAHRVLDIGCGSCDLVQYLAGAYGQEVTGVDISDGSFPSRRQTSDGSRYDCLKRDAAGLTFAQDGSADAVVSMWALHEMAGPDEILREAHRVLRPGGEIFIVDFPHDSLAQRLWNENYFRPGQVKILLREAGFEEVHVRLIERGHVMWARGYRPPLVRNGTSGPHGQEHTKAEAQE
ncbi:MAG: class I SAM-dependent methyltransferase [bacterium]